ncbi:hypothetical protein EB796_008526 [Bugula neritina]|uniref:Uncharacterized protein n=1 Tax=Bugula neritina TaxID=10212 RepID=A0A7J7K4N4_BUGNE|nr:hypothetical protein EB796_008526 [Bugula neritina]
MFRISYMMAINLAGLTPISGTRAHGPVIIKPAVTATTNANSCPGKPGDFPLSSNRYALTCPGECWNILSFRLDGQ